MKTLIVIGGATGSGKTDLAISIAQKLSCPIISADSRQVYQELNIGVGRPSVSDLGKVKHYFIASHSIHNPLNAGRYEKEALSLVEELFEKHDKLILCGGTGLYIKALVEGLDTLPKADEHLREGLKVGFEKNGISYLQDKLKEIDPNYFAVVEKENPQRLMRAIEIAVVSGMSNLEVKQKSIKSRPFATKGFCIEMERELLYKRINRRVDQMIEDGLEDEVRSLVPFSDLEVLNTVGYKEFFEYFSSKMERETCIELIKRNTRRYAKRQITWFSHQGDFVFLKPDEIEKEAMF